MKELHDLQDEKCRRIALYFLAILPPKIIEVKIRHFKQEIKERFGFIKALKLPSHITLQIPFTMPEVEEVNLERILKKIAEEQSFFQIELDGFHKFSSRVIFVNIADPLFLTNLQRRLSTTLESEVPIVFKKNRNNFHPHINIASGDIGKDNFHEVWKEFSNREFKAGFVAENFHLFKHNGHSWDIFKLYPFSAGTQNPIDEYYSAIT